MPCSPWEWPVGRVEKREAAAPAADTRTEEAPSDEVLPFQFEAFDEVGREVAEEAAFED